MNVYIHAKRVAKDDLAKLLEALHNGQNFAFVIVAEWRDIFFEWFPLTNSSRLNESEWGRAFGESGEVRWRRDEKGNGFLCRWIFDGEKPQCEGTDTFPATGLRRQEETFLLWGMPLWNKDGKWVRNDDRQRLWYVSRIPRELVYPIDDSTARIWENATRKQDKRAPLCVLVRFYLQEGRPLFDRFVRLERYQVTT